VIYRLEPDGDGTRVFFEHSGFDMSQRRAIELIGKKKVTAREVARQRVQTSSANATAF
jgi:hypothetical protein